MHTRDRNLIGSALRTSWLNALACFASAANAATLTVTVEDRSGDPIGDVAVYAMPIAAERADAAASLRTIMDQRGQRFVPHLLVVESGTAVEFPNHDTVRHHVYSFSPAKSFELSLYSGRAHEPIVFDKPGIVDVGCNIHDNMEAHILVVDTPYFAVTSAAGDAVIDTVPEGEYAIGVYTPRLSARSQPETRAITISTSSAHLHVRIDKRLRPAHTTSNESLEWSSY